MYKFINKSKSFIPSSFAINDFDIAKPGKNKWFHGDSKTLFKKNLEIMPIDWYYRTHDVTYTVNSLGYRAPEFDTVDWKNSVVIFGCSHVFGIGVDDNDTISAYLSKILEMPVINLGSGGTGIHFSHHNSLILSQFYPTPLAVIHMWTNFSRMTFYHHNRVLSVGAWNQMESNDYRIWIELEENAETYAYFARMSAKAIWNNRCTYYDFSGDPYTAEILGCDITPPETHSWELPNHLKARDGDHQPPIHLKATAKFISYKLFLKGLKFNLKNLENI